MPSSNIIVYGTNWCGDCFRTRKFLNDHAVPYTWVNIDQNKQAEQFVIQTNHGNRSVPTIVLENDTILVEPSNHELARKLGITS